MKILQIGCGNMGKVIAQIAAKHFDDITIITKTQKTTQNQTFEEKNVKCVLSFDQIAHEKFDVVILAVKPQNFGEVLQLAKVVAKENTEFFSIMAGVSLELLSKALESKNVMRLMPNLGMKEGCGVTLVEDKLFSKTQNEIIKRIFQTNGNIVVKVKEQEINNLTPLTGSSAALFLQLAQSLITKCGMEKVAGEKVVIEKVVIENVMEQALKMLKSQSCNAAIEKIASKGGITQAMVNAVENDMQSIATKAIEAGQERAKSLAAEIENSLKLKIA